MRAKRAMASSSASTSPGGRPRKPSSSTRAFRLAQHLRRLAGPSGSSRSARVVEDLGRDATRAQHDRQAELRVTHHAEQELGAAHDLLLDQPALERAAGCRAATVACSSAHTAATSAGATPTRTPPRSLLCPTSRDRILTTTGPSRLRANAAASAGGARDLLTRRGNPELGEQRQAVRLVELAACAARGHPARRGRHARPRGVGPRRRCDRRAGPRAPPRTLRRVTRTPARRRCSGSCTMFGACGFTYTRTGFGELSGGRRAPALPPACGSPRPDEPTTTTSAS